VNTPASSIFVAPEPRALLDHCHQKSTGAVNQPDVEALVLMADLLETQRVPADLLAAIYKAEVLIPGVTLVSTRVKIWTSVRNSERGPINLLTRGASGGATRRVGS
jgi:hypothetical protein